MSTHRTSLGTEGCLVNWCKTQQWTRIAPKKNKVTAKDLVVSLVQNGDLDWIDTWALLHSADVLDETMLTFQSHRKIIVEWSWKWCAYESVSMCTGHMAALVGVQCGCCEWVQNPGNLEWRGSCSQFWCTSDIKCRGSKGIKMFDYYQTNSFTLGVELPHSSGYGSSSIVLGTNQGCAACQLISSSTRACWLGRKVT